MAESHEREIQDLRSLFWSDRDPDGRGFAPLADAYRKTGQIEEALELLEEGLDRLPSFSTGHLVAGRVHRDRGATGEAVASFRRVLELDEDNVKALRALVMLLGDQGELEEARALLERLKALEPPERPRTEPEKEAEPAVEEGEAVGEPEAPPGVEAEKETADAGPEDDDLEFEGLFPEREEQEPVAIEGVFGEEGPPAEESAEEEFEGATGREAEAEEHGEGAPESDLEEQEAFDPSAFGVSDRGERETKEYVEGGEEMGVVDAPIEDFALASEEPAAETDAVDLGELAPEEPEEAVDLGELAPEEGAAVEMGELAPEEGPEEVKAEVEPVEADALAPEEPAAEADAVDLGELAPEEPEEAVDLGELAPEGEAGEKGGPYTRTMAEIYVRQGLVERAVEVYEHLLRADPDAAELKRRLKELRGEAEAPDREKTVSGYFERLLSWEPSAAPGEERAGTGEEGGRDRESASGDDGEADGGGASNSSRDASE